MAGDRRRPVVTAFDEALRAAERLRAALGADETDGLIEEDTHLTAVALHTGVPVADLRDVLGDAASECAAAIAAGHCTAEEALWGSSLAAFHFGFEVGKRS